LVEQDVLIDIRERLVRVETKIDNQNAILAKVDTLEDRVIETEQRSKSNTHQIKEIKDNLTWLWRTVAGALIVLGLSAAVWVIKQGGI